MRAIAIAIYVIVGIMILAFGSAYAGAPSLPKVDRQFSLEKEQRIHQLEHLSIQAVFQAFESPEFFDEVDYLDKAIFQAFNFRTGQAIDRALGYARSTRIANSPEGGWKLYIAKRIVQVFPDEALDGLLDIYASSGPKIRANVIYMIGQMAGEDVVRTLLVEALYDTSICQDVLAETLGEPLRICDAAYNQLVIRYRFKDVLRTIGSVHAIAVRDHHIQLLQNRL